VCRWNAEPDLHNIKSTMGMQVLHCRTPDMNEKQLWVHLLAYDQIRLLSAQAVSNARVDPRSLSFKQTCQLWAQWVWRGVPVEPALFEWIELSKVGHCTDRIEPGQ
jgi:hypothetical protein